MLGTSGYRDQERAQDMTSENVCFSATVVAPIISVTTVTPMSSSAESHGRTRGAELRELSAREKAAFQTDGIACENAPFQCGDGDARWLAVEQYACHIFCERCAAIFAEMYGLHRPLGRGIALRAGKWATDGLPMGKNPAGHSLGDGRPDRGMRPSLV